MKNIRVSTFSVVSLLLGCVLTAGCGSGDELAVAQGVPTDVSGVTQNWDKALPAASRFVVLAAFNNDAVRDNETGLVWERSPQTPTAAWIEARRACITKNVGGRRGWRLPSVPELASLIDPSVVPQGPTLPAGHPFTNVLSTNYWSATTDAENPTNALAVIFLNGNVDSTNKANSFQVWCVRGGMNADTY